MATSSEARAYRTRTRGWIAPAVGLVLVLAYLSPLWVLGQDARVRVHDNLDSNIVWLKVLAESGKVFAASDAVIPNFLGGLPRSALGSGFNVILWLFCLFPPFVAYAVNMALMRVVAFIGMYLLAARLLADPDRRPLAAGIALGFALLPFWPPGGLSVAGQPLILYCFLRLARPDWSIRRWRHLVPVAAYPLYSSLVLSGAFLTLVLGVVYAVVSIRRKWWHPGFLLGLAVLTLGYLAVEWRLVASTFLGAGVVPHRVEFVPSHMWTFSQSVRHGWSTFRDSYWGHAYAVPFPFLHAAWVLAIATAAWRRRAPDMRLVACLAFVVAVSAYFGVYGSEWFAHAVRARVPILNQFNSSRFYFLLPAAFFVILALSAKGLLALGRLGRVVASVLVVGQCATVVVTGDTSVQAGGPTYRQFYSEDLFRQVRAAIPEDVETFRVASLGIHPAVLQYNGFLTVDGYHYDYPLAYKHRFRQVIAKELDKSPELRAYFDGWGSRAYLFSAELGKTQRSFFVTKDRHMAVRDLAIDPAALAALGGRYVVSAVSILNAPRVDLRLVGTFEDARSPLRVYLYRVSGEEAS